MSATKPIHIAVLVPRLTQLLDIAAVDILAMLDKTYLEMCKLPPHIASLGISTTISYVTTSANGTLAPTTANLYIANTFNINDDEVAPTKVDILVVPGPDPFVEPPEDEVKYVRDCFEAGATVLSICSGITIVSASGILKGRKATGPKPLVPSLKDKYPDVDWVEKRWVEGTAAGESSEVSAKVWCSGGILNGIDLASAYVIKEYPQLGKLVVGLADVTIRGADYPANDITSDKDLFDKW